MLSLNFHDIAFITIKVVDYCCIIHDISKPEAINFQKVLYLIILGIYKKHTKKIKIKNRASHHYESLIKPTKIRNQ